MKSTTDLVGLDLESRLLLLEKQSDRLNEATAKANRLLADTGSRLAAMQFGLEYWSDIPERDDSKGGLGRYETHTEVLKVMGFAKVEGDWMLAVKSVRRVHGFFEGDTACPYMNEFLEEEPTPIVKASRSVRLAAAAKLPEFVSGLMEYVKQRADQIGDSTED